MTRDATAVILRFEDKTICEPEMTVLWAYFRVIERNKYQKAVKKFLSTTTLCTKEDHRQVTILFEELYTRFKSSRPSKKCRATLIFGRLSLTGSGLKKARRTGDLLRKLIEIVEEFLVQKSLSDRPALRTMILAEAVKMHDENSLFQTILKRWSTAISEMKIGTWSLYQRWRYEDAVHFNPDQAKVKSKYGNLPAAKASLKIFVDFYNDFYEAERLNRLNLVDKEPEWDMPIDMEVNRLLVDLYASVRRLLAGEGFHENRFDQNLSLLEKHYADITPYHRLNLFLFVLNYIAAMSRKEVLDPAKYYRQCLPVLLKEDFLDEITSFTSSFFLNRMTEATISGDKELIRQVKSTLLPLVASKQRVTTELLADVRIAFNQEKHKEVVELLTYTDKKEKSKTRIVKVIGFHNLIMLKLFLVRSLLVLHISGEDPGDLFSRLTGSLFKLLEDNRNDFSPDRKKEIAGFVRASELLYRTDLEMISPEEYQKVYKRLMDPEVLGYRKWLRCFLGHFNPALKPAPRPIQPTINRNQPWASGEVTQ